MSHLRLQLCHLKVQLVQVFVYKCDERLVKGDKSGT